MGLAPTIALDRECSICRSLSVTFRPTCSRTARSSRRAGIVYAPDNKKYSFADAAYAAVTDGHLHVYQEGNPVPSNILAMFAPGKWFRFVHDEATVLTQGSTSRTLKVSVVSES